MAVFRSGRFFPGPVVAEEVSKSSCRRIEGVLKERQVPGRQLGGVDTRWSGFGIQLRQLRGKNEGAGIVVRSVAFTPVGDSEDRVLQDSRVIGHSLQVLKVESRQLIH